MEKTEEYVRKILENRKIQINEKQLGLFDAFVNESETIESIAKMLEAQELLVDNWLMKSKIDEILRQSVLIPNGTVGKIYTAFLDLEKLGWKQDITECNLTGFDETGLCYNAATCSLSGAPTQSGDFKLVFRFKINNDANWHDKPINLTINPDPKTLWKNKPSNKDGLFWKDDNVALAGTLGDKQIVVASKRGRSHANVGSFRDDDFNYKAIGDSGWNVIAVADGAGSAYLSRQGSLVACSAIIEYFEQNLQPDFVSQFDETLRLFKTEGGEEIQKKLSHSISDLMSKAAWYAHQKLVQVAKETEKELKDFHSTLIFSLFKKYDFGYAFLSFGVGDCPIALLNKDMTEVTLMNWLDVGEYGGGTRFITMPEIFTSDKFYTRFKFKLVEDFGFLMMMTDGVYDPKFVVEANLEKIDKWQAFVADLKGENEDKIAVNFDKENVDIAQQLSEWMDFWSPGNHDDRTLAIVY